MAPFVVLVIATLLLRVLGALGVERLASWRVAGRVGLAIMFLFTGATHFTSMKHDYAAMIPPPLTGSLWLIALTGSPPTQLWLRALLQLVFVMAVWWTSIRRPAFGPGPRGGV